MVAPENPLSDPRVDSFLASLGLGTHQSRFARDRITFEVLSDLDDADLIELGMTALGERRRFLVAARHCETSQAQAATTEGPRAAAGTVTVPAHANGGDKDSGRWTESTTGDPATPIPSIATASSSNSDTGEASSLDDLTQAMVDRYCADTPRFWATSFETIQRPYAPLKATASQGKDAWVQIVLDYPDARAAFDNFAQYPALRDEGIVAWGGGHTLTNYRIILNVNGATTSIPLADLATYEQNTDSNFIVRYREQNDIRTIVVASGVMIVVSAVNAVLAAREYVALNSTERILLCHSTLAIQRRHPKIQVPRIAMMARPRGMSPLKKAEVQKGLNSVLGLVLLVGLIAIAGNVCSRGSSGESTSSRRVLQNGQIPGYSRCIDRLAATCPRCSLKECCDEVGGDNYRSGTFPTCEKYL